MIRDDDPQAVNMHASQYNGGRALVVLGGPSGANWEKLYDEIKPDVLIGVNGVGQQGLPLDYWLLAENLNFWHKESATNKHGMKRRAIKLLRMMSESKAKVRLVNRKNKSIMAEPGGVVWTKRSHIEYKDLPDFDFRAYGDGLMNGALMQRPKIIKNLRAGTVGLQSLHLAGILGCAEVHTIGFDLHFPAASHHWYKYPEYVQDGHYWIGDPFTKYEGLSTTWFWYDTMNFLRAAEPYMLLAGLNWKDHSGGLLKAANLRCATT